jgi:hypothetical protein
VIFVGIDTQVTDVYLFNIDEKLIKTLRDNIRQRSATNMLISDSAQVILVTRVLTYYAPCLLVACRVKLISNN